MELNQVNSISMPNLAELQMSKSKSINSVENSPINKPLEVDKIETTGKIQNSFSVNVIDNISKISKMQSIQPQLNKQIEIVNKIETLTKEMTTNPAQGKVLDDIQPEIKKLMDNFNTSSKVIAESLDNVSNLNNEEKSRMYFDGILGSKPLSGKEIFEAVTAQREKLLQDSNNVKQELEATVEQTKSVISTEKEAVETKPAVKNIDFQVESTKFDSQSIKSFEGSVTETQANAQPQQNIKLLAS
jgi:hypothetical protein